VSTAQTRGRTSARTRRANGEPLTEQAYHLLEEKIVTLQLKPSEFLSEYALVSQLGLGRTPIREALQRLAREGLVLILPRKGILVAPADPDKQLLVLEVRRELERLLSRSAAKRATPEQLGRLRDIAKRCQSQRRSRLHAARSRPQLVDHRGGTQRVCVTCYAAAAGIVPAVLVSALSDRRRSAALRASTCGPS
jgi:DNA-binding GntR family transcriptional regulator